MAFTAPTVDDSFDAKSPYRPTFLSLLTHATPSAERNRRRFARSLASIDAQVLVDGGWMLGLGQEEATRSLLRTYRRLPAVRFETVAGSSGSPVVFRRASHGGSTWVYAVNDSPYATAAQVRVDASADTYFSYLANPAYADPECDKSAAYLKDEKTTPFLVVMDTHMTETAMLADMVLPAATYLEGWGCEFAPPLDGNPVFNLGQPVVSLISAAEALRSPSFDAGKLIDPTFRPLGEAKEVGNVFLKLGKDLGGAAEKRLPYKDTQDFLSHMISSVLPDGIVLADLKKKGFWTNKKSRILEEQSLAINRGLRLPEYVPFPTRENKNPNQFILTPFKTNLGTNGMENSKWAREILHENRLWMNKQKAAQLGIKNGEKIRVTSSVGSLTLRVLITNLIHPESVALAEGLGHTAFGSLARAQKSQSKDTDTELLWWSKKGKGVNPYSTIENRADPVGGGLASKDTMVQVYKIEE